MYFASDLFKIVGFLSSFFSHSFYGIRRCLSSIFIDMPVFRISNSTKIKKALKKKKKKKKSHQARIKRKSSEKKLVNRCPDFPFATVSNSISVVLRIRKLLSSTLLLEAVVIPDPLTNGKNHPYCRKHTYTYSPSRFPARPFN